MPLNVAVIMGRITADPELKHTTSDIAVTSFTVAVERGYTKAGAEKQVDFIDVVAWRQTAEFVCKYFQKGSMIAINGHIQTRMYEDKNGNKRKAVEIVADNVNFTGEKKKSGSAGSKDNDDEYMPPENKNHNEFSESSAPCAIGGEEGFQEVLGDDDLLF